VPHVNLIVRQIKLIAASMLALALLWAPNATMAATSKNVPPGVSGANQYTETLPGPGGNSPTRHLKSETHGPRSAARVLGGDNARKLKALGPEGRAAARLATETAPEGEGGHTKRGKHDGGGAPLPGKPGGSGSSGVQQVLGQMTGTGGSTSGGMGWLLPLLIGASVVVAVTYLFTRRRPARP
jgi:hypothetical protein